MLQCDNVKCKHNLNKDCKVERAIWLDENGKCLAFTEEPKPKQINKIEVWGNPTIEDFSRNCVFKINELVDVVNKLLEQSNA
jgi:hypothetical protein